jgi:hypothetical protein
MAPKIAVLPHHIGYMYEILTVEDGLTWAV